MTRTLRFRPEMLAVDDRGRNDCELFWNWTDQGVHFVTRLKDSAVYRKAKNLPVLPNKAAWVQEDQIISFNDVGVRDRVAVQMRLATFYG